MRESPRDDCVLVSDMSFVERSTLGHACCSLRRSKETYDGMYAKRRVQLNGTGVETSAQGAAFGRADW